jgi:hypothetical protein
MMKRPIPLLLACALTAITLSPAAARDLVVVELFTSQGCSSCPPADALLGDLAKRDDVLALSLHVDYWDYIGWKDPFASPANTQRQRAYARQFGLGYVYTPQMVVNGRSQMTGSNRPAVLHGIDQAKGAPGLAIELKRDGNTLTASLPQGDADGDAAVYAVLFDNEHVTDVRRGENRGRKLAYSNVVRDMERVATWRGAALTLPLDRLPTDGRDACAVIVQSERTGRILGSAVIDLKS